MFVIGGGLYVAMEFFWRGRSHVSMFLAGGAALVLLGGVYTRLSDWPVPVLLLLGTTLITALEFIFGAIVNVRLGLRVWDYSHLRFNLYGQICLLYSGVWFLLAGLSYPIVQVVNAL